MSKDEEFNLDQENPEEYDTEEWEDVLGPEEQICSELSALDISNTLGSTVWLYFDKNPSYAPGYNVCKKCSRRYKTTTGVSSLRKHLKNTKIHNKYLTDWLICDLQPFTVIETHHFKAFLNFFCPNYIIPDRHKAKGINLSCKIS